MKTTKNRAPKTTTRTKTPKRTTAKTQAPFGLTLLFSMVRDYGETQDASTMYAARAFPIALKLIERAHDVDEDSLMPILLESVTPMFDNVDLEDPTEPSHVADAAFRIGIATAWVLMRGLSADSMKDAYVP